MRVAIVHYWLIGMRGGEQVLEAICRLYPAADIFTLFYDPSAVSPYLRSRNIKASYLNPLRRFHRSLLPAMPLALESFDLRGYDLIISSESGPAKGVLTPSTARHICYCHTPMRYLWELYPDYRNDFAGLAGRMLMAPFASWLRTWDYASAARVDAFAANSWNVRRRIWKVWRRRSRVVPPPVNVESFYYAAPQDYFLMVSEMVPYKRLDYAVDSFRRSGRRLKIVGTGPELASLRKLAGPNIEFCGRVNDAELRELFAHCQAFVMPGEEDFGITMVEAMASGKPVIALGRGGAKELVRDGCGILYPEHTHDELEAALARFDRCADTFRPLLLTTRAAEFSPGLFERRFRTAAAGQWDTREQEIRNLAVV